MFEEIISLKVDQAVKHLPANKSHLSLLELLAISELDKFIKIYLLSEVSWWIHLKKLQLLSDNRFLFPKNDIEELLHNIENIYLTVARFESNQLYNEIESAIKLHINYLCRPKTTLKQFVFRDETQISYFELQARLNYFSDYEYLKDAVRQMISDKEKNMEWDRLISVYEFENCINNLDAHFSEHLDAEGFLYSISPMIKFFNKELSENNNYNLPVPALLLIFDDKQLSGLYSALYDEYDNGKENITAEELKTLLDNIFLPVVQ